MTNTTNSQSQKRTTESMGALFSKEKHSLNPCSLLILTSSSDVGVMRNGGRNGSRLAPQSLLSSFKKLNQSENHQNFSCYQHEVTSISAEQADFVQAQLTQAQHITHWREQYPHSRLLHLGGGHDHIFPLLTSLSASPKIIVINIDAHADTRTDEESHSGTPFRQFAREYAGEFHLFQVGLHQYSNSLSTLAPLEKGQSHILWRNDLSDEHLVSSFFKSIKKLIDQKTLVIFSLDADALAGPMVPGVSAVNGNGLDYQELELVWKHYLQLEVPHPCIMGIYELNPVYDTLSGMSMRTLSSFIYQSLQ